MRSDLQQCVLLEIVLILAGGGLTLGACWGAGRLLFPSIDLHSAVRFGLGAILVSNLVFLVLIAGWARDRVLLGLLIILWLPLVRWRPRLPRRPDVPPLWYLIIAACYAGLYFVHALAPEIQPDAVTYHLGLVREWLRLNGFASRAGLYETLPHGLEMLFVPAYALGGHSAAKLVHLAFLVATVPLLTSLARRLGLAPSQGASGAALYFCAPVVGVAACSAYNDAALVCFTVAAAWLLVRWHGDPRWQYAAAAGQAAGFCYAIKMPGGIAIAAGFLYLAWMRSWRAAGIFAAGAALVIAPWLLRNAIWTGNPFAPLLNWVFENPYFHIASEHELTESLRDQKGFSVLAAPLEITLRGWALDGLIGPVFLLAPLVLLGWRKRTVRALLAAALVLAIPWLLNPGTRFLMPSLPFLSLGLAAALPQPAGVGLAIAHAVLSLPPAIGVYSNPDAWRLKGFPLRAALRLEPETEYLPRALWTTELASLINQHAEPGDVILDLYGAPWAYIDAVPMRPSQSASADRMNEALKTGAMTGGGTYIELEARWPARPLTALRFQLAESRAPDWSVHEIRIQAPAVADRTGWRLAAWPNVWEAPLALDGSLVTRWAAWEKPRTGMYVQVHFPVPVEVSGATLTGRNDERQTEVEWLGQEPDGTWRLLAKRPNIRLHPAIELRRSAIQAVRGEGARFILAPIANSLYADLGANLLANPLEWSVKDLGSVRGVHLFRIE